jgi:hypothetical protein
MGGVGNSPFCILERNINMGLPVDMSGDDLYVNALYVGASTPGTLVGAVTNTVNLTAATATLTTAQSGTVFTFNRAAGTTVTLPAAVVGTTYIFVIGTVATSNAQKVITPASVFLAGGINIDKSLTVTRYAADGSTIRSINLNGTTTGGATVGDIFTITCTSSTLWTVSGTVTASGTLATPFATS